MIEFCHVKADVIESLGKLKWYIDAMYILSADFSNEVANYENAKANFLLELKRLDKEILKHI